MVDLAAPGEPTGGAIAATTWPGAASRPGLRSTGRDQPRHIPPARNARAIVLRCVAPRRHRVIEHPELACSIYATKGSRQQQWRPRGFHHHRRGMDATRLANPTFTRNIQSWHAAERAAFACDGAP